MPAQRQAWGGCSAWKVGRARRFFTLTRGALLAPPTGAPAGTLANLVFNCARRHPFHPERPLIDWDLILVRPGVLPHQQGLNKAGRMLAVAAGAASPAPSALAADAPTPARSSGHGAQHDSGSARWRLP